MKTQAIRAAFAVGVALLAGGCATGPYVRSDVFLDAQKVRSIFVMPVVTEVTLDAGCTLDRAKLERRLALSRVKVKEVVAAELTRRGYAVAGFSKDFQDLRDDVPLERALRDAVRTYL